MSAVKIRMQKILFSCDLKDFQGVCKFYLQFCNKMSAVLQQTYITGSANCLFNGSTFRVRPTSC